MTGETSRVTLHMVSSLDGFIGKKDGSVSWLETSDSYDKGEADGDAEAFMKTIDCFVMGSQTYELALKLGWPYGDVPTIVLTHRELPAIRQTVAFYSGDLNELVTYRLKPKYENIWMVGGAMLAKDFLRLRLADDIRLTIAPIILGGGMLFLDHIGHEQALHLKGVTAYKNGFVELWYEVRVESKQRWPLFVAHELAGYLLNVNAASTIKPLPYRGAERAAEVTLLERNWPPFFSANFFGPAFFLSS
jgi:dihydrofolate reductase